LWERAAETGDFPAAFNAGLYHDHAAEKRDQPENPAKAARFYRIASAKGHVPASTNLGLLLLCRPELAASLDEDQAFLKLSYDHGDAKAGEALKFLERRLDHVMSDLDNGRIPGERTLEVQEMTRAMAGSAKAADLFIERSQTTTALSRCRGGCVR
jgi:TPR repeat protein